MKDGNWFLVRLGLYAGAALTFLFLFSATCFAEIWQLRNPNGGTAVNLNTDPPEVWSFRPGDVISVNAGWREPSTDDGWVRLRPGMKRQGPPKPDTSWYDNLPPFPGLQRPWGRRSPPPLPCWAGMYRLDGYDSVAGQTAILCTHPAGCLVTKWWLGMMRVDHGTLLDPSEGWTPIFPTGTEWAVFFWAR